MHVISNLFKSIMVLLLSAAILLLADLDKRVGYGKASNGEVKRFAYGMSQLLNVWNEEFMMG